MNKTITKIDRNVMQSMTDTLLAARKNNLKEVLEIAHRLETVAVVDDVTYINDSKSTNVNATLYSFECMTRPVVWIASSSDWAQDYSPLGDLVRTKVKAIVCVETKNCSPAFDFSFGVAVWKCHTIDDALCTARELAASGDAVLYSPAHPAELCFGSYKERGVYFRNLINPLFNSI